MLQGVLNHIPQNWDILNYNESSYHLVEVTYNTQEYNRVASLFDGSFQVLRIQRVQNPFQYGRFVLQKEKLIGSNVTEKTRFVPISENYKNVALTYNCDYRRLSWAQDTFFDTSRDARNYKDNGLIIVVKALNVNLERDSTRYPEYLVSYAV